MTEPNSKSGTTIVKSAPPKETARITVKPNLPGAAVKAGGNFPTAKPVPGAVPVAAAAGAAVGAAAVAKAVATKPTVKASDAPKPATTIVKTAAAPKVAAATVKPSGTVPVPAMSSQFQDEGSTTLTTALAGVLAGITWVTAIALVLNLAGAF